MESCLQDQTKFPSTRAPLAGSKAILQEAKEERKEGRKKKEEENRKGRKEAKEGREGKERWEGK